MIGICGDNCELCPRFVATRSGRPEDLLEVKALWVRLGLRDPAFPTERLACSGCTPENECAYPEVRACAHENSAVNCGVCPSYPCGLIAAVFAGAEQLRSRAARVCTPEEFSALEGAFFSKKQNLARQLLRPDLDVVEDRSARHGIGVKEEAD